jgi:hypothetical protein
MDVKIPEDVLYEMVELLVEPKYLDPSENECVLHLDKRDRLLDQLLVLRRKALASKKGIAMLNVVFPIKNRAA